MQLAVLIVNLKHSLAKAFSMHLNPFLFCNLAVEIESKLFKTNAIYSSNPLSIQFKVFLTSHRCLASLSILPINYLAQLSEIDLNSLEIPLLSQSNYSLAA